MDALGEGLAVQLIEQFDATVQNVPSPALVGVLGKVLGEVRVQVRQLRGGVREEMFGNLSCTCRCSRFSGGVVGHEIDRSERR